LRLVNTFNSICHPSIGKEFGKIFLRKLFYE
jgi:hypothetical protein